MAKNNNNNSNEDSQPITKDGRFASVHNDPRFKLPNLNRFKVKVDSRFSKKELEKLSAGSSGKKAKIDRYGRKIKDDEKRNLDKFYEHEDDSDEKEEEEEADSDNSKSDDESESSEGEEEDVAQKALDRARGEVSGSSSSEEDSDSSDSSDSEEEVVFEEEESDIELEETKPQEGEPTDTFAVVNMDWDNLRAVDLMATFLSFVPANGLIKSVTMYPSEFGKEQMQKEEIEGPPRDVFKKRPSKDDDDSESDSDTDSIDVNNADDLEKAARKLYTEDNGEEDYDSKALRRYQLQRLRYYYAVVKCDSVKTAKSIYDNCDGTEYESTANIFDLRYVPEDMDFDENEAKDSCTKVPASYKPESNFVTDALQHSKVKLTWDETPKERQNLSSRQFSQKEIDDMDFKAYLASDTDGSDAEQNDDAKNKYKSLLGGMSFGKDEKNEADVDMEITFNPGLDDQAEQADAKSEREEESTIAAYKRKEKERRKRRMDKFKKEQEEQKAVDPVDDKKKNTRRIKASGDDEKSKAELELIMMDEEKVDKHEHFSMRDIVKAEKQKNRKKNKKNKNIDTEMTQDSFKADLNDSRFNEIFENHDYAIDPTSSEYKKTETMKQIMSERSKRHRSNGSSSEPNKKQKKDAKSSSSNNEITSMVNKLKRKHKSK